MKNIARMSAAVIPAKRPDFSSRLRFAFLEDGKNSVRRTDPPRSTPNDRGIAPYPGPSAPFAEGPGIPSPNVLPRSTLMPSDDGGVRETMTEPQGFQPEDLFKMAERRDGDATIVALAGELDFGTVGQVQARLAELRDEGNPTLLDLDSLTFMDSTGIRLVLTACEDAQRGGWSFRVTRGSERVRRVLEAAQVIDRLP